jgi:hypothetical protein
MAPSCSSSFQIGWLPTTSSHRSRLRPPGPILQYLDRHPHVIWTCHDVHVRLLLQEASYEQAFASHQIPVPSTGVLCYTDVSSISLDSSSPQLRQAGIGINYVNKLVQLANTICVRATVKDISSVVMTEAAALALADACYHHGVFSGHLIWL